jgi:ATP-dependent RNA helicase RhlE
LTTFSDLGLAETLLRAVTAEGYTAPTPIQADVIPLLLEGRDVMGLAQTGTGKTASFVLPLLHRIDAATDRPAPRTARALILAPTRELAAQIAEEIGRYARFMRLSTAVVVGGVKPGPQVKALSRGVDILVATPGRLLDHMGSGAADLSRTRTVVLDEADQMLDLGFMPAIRRIMKALPKPRQTALMSATMPDEIEKLARDFQNDPVRVAVTPVSRPIEEIAQSVIEAEHANKSEVLARVLSAPEVSRAIVFTRTKHGADKVKRRLEAAGLPATAIHGNKSQGQRNRALDAFRSGEAPILVATDIAARGIHVDDVSHVVNYELPEVAEVYVHRIGRTGRAGRGGVAVSLCDPAERKLLRAIERLTGLRLAPEGARAARAERPAAGRPPAPKPRPGARGAAPNGAERPAGSGRRRRRGGRPNAGAEAGRQSAA